MILIQRLGAPWPPNLRAPSILGSVGVVVTPLSSQSNIVNWHFLLRNHVSRSKTFVLPEMH